MACGCQKNWDSELNENEICCCGQLYQFSLANEGGNGENLLVAPCDQPTAIFDIATITTKSNSCMNLTYYQAVVNTDPVEIIQDCNLKCLICRAIELYMKNNSCGCGCQKNCNNRGFSIF